MSWFKRFSAKDLPHNPSQEPDEALLRRQAMAIHDGIIEKVLQIIENEELQLADNFELRFDLLILLVSNLLRHLHIMGNQLPLSQTLWELTFESLEESLRDRGVTDIRLAARMRKLLQNATGRRNAYLLAWDESSTTAIGAAIARNVLNGCTLDDPRIDRIVAHLPGFAQAMLQLADPPIKQ
ncbi:ubiquinol-cytochrome C chaperone family protein [Candidatus Magnetaquicoccus inordinatus]|uniref:ubiquinol-cytochrome C chaperone family protein n=1 Tax=Candidatus Magnetaquicoccus inordinatus TaxID=2496818 RepID=UPI00102CEEED|nr:ubiquinol-cytochrome C chaperone family protein [Candidatus Magnetaquicoccus inordinatus]